MVRMSSSDASSKGLTSSPRHPTRFFCSEKEQTKETTSKTSIIASFIVCFYSVHFYQFQFQSMTLQNLRSQRHWTSLPLALFLSRNVLQNPKFFASRSFPKFLFMFRIAQTFFSIGLYTRRLSRRLLEGFCQYQNYIQRHVFMSYWQSESFEL